MKYNEIDIKNFLNQLIGREIIYIPNPGNAGDKLIAWGTYEVFKTLGLNYTIGDPKKVYDKQVLIYAGGGNLVGIYSDCRHFLLANKDNNEIIILPHTVIGEDELIANLGDTVKIVCRERRSYQYVHRLMKNKDNVFLSSDMALYIDVPERFQSGGGAGELDCFRQDVESTGVTVPDNNIDLSVKLNLPELDFDTAIKISLAIFDYLSIYAVINTNRLHLAIAGCLLGKMVNFHSNNYYKNEAVYSYSLKNRFRKQIVFHDAAPIRHAAPGSNRVGVFLDSQETDLLRDLAIEIEQVEVSRAYKLMKIAGRARPDGSFIQGKIDEYKTRIGN